MTSQATAYQCRTRGSAINPNHHRHCRQLLIPACGAHTRSLPTRYQAGHGVQSFIYIELYITAAHGESYIAANYPATCLFPHRVFRELYPGIRRNSERTYLPPVNLYAPFRGKRATGIGQVAWRAVCISSSPDIASPPPPYKAKHCDSKLTSPPPMQRESDGGGSWEAKEGV